MDWLWRRGEPVRLFDRYEIKRYPASFAEVKEGFEALQTCICAPLQTKAGLTGLMVLGDKESGNYTEEDLRILETLANHSALAIHNLKLQEDLHASKELESFYKLSSFVLHDLKNIASIITMLAENAQHNMEDPEFRASLTTTLANSSGQIKKMLSKVSLVSSSQNEIAVEGFDVAELIQLVAREVARDARYQIDVQVQEGLELRSDPRLVRKVLLNLMLNALDAMPDGGQLCVRAASGAAGSPPEPHLAGWRPEAFVRFSVTDSGCGMTQDFIRKKLFKPFQTTKNKGLGLGLYHCREMVESLAGRIWVESEINQGTTFHVALADNPAGFAGNGARDPEAQLKPALS